MLERKGEWACGSRAFLGFGFGCTCRVRFHPSGGWWSKQLRNPWQRRAIGFRAYCYLAAKQARQSVDCPRLLDTFLIGLCRLRTQNRRCGWLIANGVSAIVQCQMGFLSIEAPNPNWWQTVSIVCPCVCVWFGFGGLTSLLCCNWIVSKSKVGRFLVAAAFVRDGETEGEAPKPATSFWFTPNIRWCIASKHVKPVLFWKWF